MAALEIVARLMQPKNAKDAVDVENLRCRGRGMRGAEHGGDINSPGDDKAKGRGRGRGGVQPGRTTIRRLGRGCNRR